MITVPKAISTAKKSKTAVKYRKDPNAPKRFKSAFIFFSMAKHPEMRHQLEMKAKGGGKNTPDVAKLVSKAWRNLNPKEREVWDEMARKDKERYEIEKRFYTGPWKIAARKRSKKDPDAPKRPMSAFLSFSQFKRHHVRQEFPKLRNTDLSKILANMWRDASEEERTFHIEREAKERAVYRVKIADWRANNKAKMEAHREEREDLARSVLAEDSPSHASPHNNKFSNDNYWKRYHQSPLQPDTIKRSTNLSNMLHYPYEVYSSNFNITTPIFQPYDPFVHSRYHNVRDLYVPRHQEHRQGYENTTNYYNDTDTFVRRFNDVSNSYDYRYDDVRHTFDQDNCTGDEDTAATQSYSSNESFGDNEKSGLIGV